MNITPDMMKKAIEEKIITDKQSKRLIDFCHNLPDQAPGFNLENVLYYFGGLIAIGAMTLFMNLGWEQYGGWGIFFLSLCYAILGLALTHYFDKKGHPIPAGICATFVIALTPLAIYGLQKGIGWWIDEYTYSDFHRYIRWNWLYMELGTIAVGIILAWIYRYPFMIMPIAFTMWYLSMDLTPMIAGGSYNFELCALVSMYLGIITILIALWVDIRTKSAADYAFWLYLFGVLAFWGGLSAQQSNSELSKFFYLCINISMIGIGVLLNRKVFVVFGALGTCGYLSHLAFEVFNYSYLFAATLTGIGFGVIYLGILWQKNAHSLTYKMRSFLPPVFRELLERRD